MTPNEATAVVTGADRGLGRAIAVAFADAGATVVIGAADEDAVSETVEVLETRLESPANTDARPDATATGVRTDVRDEFDLERLAETASRTGDTDGIDVVVPAAGVYHGEPGSTPIDRESYAAFDDHWRRNGRGIFATIREALPHLTDEARVLVPTGSVASEATPGYGSYAVSAATAAAVARGFAADTDYTVGCLDVGSVATVHAAGGDNESSGDSGVGSDDDFAAVADAFVRAATEAPAADIDGQVVDAANRE